MAITGKIFDTAGVPVSNAIVSIQVTNPQATSVHLAVAYSEPNGTFQDNFVIPSNSPGGNYTAYLVADKPGYDTARVTLGFSFASPDFTLQLSKSELSLRQGDVGNLVITLLSVRGFKAPVNITAIDVPSGVTLQFSAPVVTPSNSTQVTIAVSQTAEVGNFTITFLAVSAGTIHTAPFQLIVTSGPIQSVYIAVSAMAAILVVVAVMTLRRRRRSQKRAAVEELLRASEADKGYVATARVIARLEELRAAGQVDESTYQKLKREYERRLEKSK